MIQSTWTSLTGRVNPGWDEDVVNTVADRVIANLPEQAVRLIKADLWKGKSLVSVHERQVKLKEQFGY
jgi:hypothetical protein